MFVLFVLIGFCCFSQKRTTSVIDRGSIRSIVLASDEIYRISISSGSGENITVRTRADGEYYQDINLDMEQVEGTLFLSSRYREILQSGFDKLSAHKVFAMEVELEVPIGMQVEVISNLASVYVYGDYERVLVQLKAGSCYLKDFRGNATVNTFGGNISVQAQNAFIEASSRHGEVDLPQYNRGDHLIKLTTINGNIHAK